MSLQDRLKNMCAWGDPIPTPTPLPPCETGEKCDDPIDAECVIYVGDPVASIGVTSGMRLKQIILNWGANQATQAIAVEDTQDVTLSGTGLATDPVKAAVKIDTVDTTNLLSTSTEGLKAVMTDAAILALLQRVAAVPELQTAFCNAVSACGEQVCGIIQSLDAQVN